MKLDLKKGDRTVTRSFRISESALIALQSESERQNVSVNTLVNQLLLAYTNYDRFAKKQQTIKLSSATFRYILQAASDESIIEAGRLAGRSVPETFILAKEGVLSLPTVLNYLKSLADYANLYEFNEVVRDNRHTITLMHGLDSKGSLFLAHYLHGLFERIEKPPVFTITDHAIILEF